MKLRHVQVALGVCALICLLSGCATMLSGTDQMVTIQSNPPGAYVQVGYQSGVTPVTFHLPKGDHQTLQVTSSLGKRTIGLHREVDPMTWLNLIPPLWPGFIVDAATGAMHRYDPEVITVDFYAGGDRDQASLAKFGW